MGTRRLPNIYQVLWTTGFWVVVVQKFLKKISCRFKKSFKPGFFVHENAENWRCSIFGTPEIGDTQNLASDWDSPSLLP